MSSEPVPTAAFRERLIVPESAIDANGHVNNVVFVQWMQDAATRHFRSVVADQSWQSMQLAWVARSHQIEYLAPAFAADELEVITWVANFSRVRSLRRYQFRRLSDQKLLVQGETDWVLVQSSTLKPVSIPPAIRQAFGVADEPSRESEPGPRP